jgi:hypothetical protein
LNFNINILSHTINNFNDTNIMYKIINSFDDVIINNSNTLIICDIDETLLTWNKKSSDFNHLVKLDFNLKDKEYEEYEEYEEYKEIEKEAQCFLNMYRVIVKPEMTDVNGFNNLLDKIIQTDSQIIFLTARPNNESSKKFTRKNFTDIGLDYDKYTIHWTNNNSISKGEYIFNNIDINKYNEIIFIDDYESYIKTVNDILHNIICYKFEANYHKLSLK